MNPWALFTIYFSNLCDCFSFKLNISPFLSKPDRGAIHFGPFHNVSSLFQLTRITA